AALASATSAGVLFINRPSTPKKQDISRVSGQLRWSQTVNAKYTVGDLTMANGVLFVTTDAGLLALNATTGRTLWQASQVISDFVAGGPVIAGNLLYVGGSGELFALDVHGGTVKWSKSLGFGSLVSTPVVANGVVYTYVSDGTLSTHRASTGDRLWSVPVSYRTFGDKLPSPGIGSGSAY